MSYYLKDDLSDTIDGYDTNPAITEAQRQIWRRDGRNKAITQVMLGNNHEKSLRLPEEDGFDGGTVGSLSGKAAQCFWDYNTGHVFPPMRDLVRFGVFMRLDIYRIIALVLKGEWERFFGHEVMGWRANLGIRLSEIMPTTINKKMRDAKDRFNPDSHVIYGLLQAHGNLAENAGYMPETFDSLVQDMLLNDLHWTANQGKAVADFVAVESRRIAVVRLGTPEQQQAFWVAKCSWTQLRTRLEEMLYRVECLNLQKEETLRQWLCAMGELEYALREEVLRQARLERRLLLKAANPKSTREEINRMVQEDEDKQLKELKDLRDKVELAPFLAKTCEGGEPADPAAIAAYQKECMKILRRIKLLTHVDGFVGKGLTEEQKTQLMELFMKAKDVDPDELGYPTNHIYHDMRSIEGLQRVLSRVEAILASAGLEVDTEHAIRGDTIAEQLEWLKQDMCYLEVDTEQARAQLQALMTDAETARMHRILASKDEQERIKTEFEQKIEEHRKQADELETKVEKAFNGDGMP
jgi:hypothetical protein